MNWGKKWERWGGQPTLPPTQAGWLEMVLDALDPQSGWGLSKLAAKRVLEYLQQKHTWVSGFFAKNCPPPRLGLQISGCP